MNYTIETKDYLLLFMCVTYMTAIYHVVIHYNDNGSISNIICNEKCNHTILLSMVLMGIGTLLYEYNRNDTWCFFFILWLLIGIYGVLNFDETTIPHYGFAVLVFCSIFGFMIYNCHKKKDFYLFFMLFFQILFLIFTFCSNFFVSHIFYGEVFMIIQFAIFYFYLHFYSEPEFGTIDGAEFEIDIIPSS